MSEHDSDAKNDKSAAEHRKDFWKRLESVNAGMLGTTGDLKLVPMSHTADPDAAALWFITAAGTHLVEQCESAAQDALHCIASGDDKLYARLEGRLELSRDEAKLDEIWNPVAASWFEGGRDDPDIRLLKLALTSAEVWTTTGGVGFLYELAKNKVTGKIPDMGEHFDLSF